MPIENPETKSKKTDEDYINNTIEHEFNDKISTIEPVSVIGKLNLVKMIPKTII